MNQSIVVPLLLVCTLSFEGCGDSNPVKRAAVEGQVTFDNQPIEQGIILFVPEVGVVGPPVQLVIENGKYASDRGAGPTIGQNAVQITANQKTGKERLVQGVVAEEVIQIIPEKYNAETTLKATITSGKNTINFDLEK